MPAIQEVAGFFFPGACRKTPWRGRKDSVEDPLGVVFDIKEFALYDGPGLRCTVFMKGCPLRCSWCHNPEGLAMEPETMKTAAGERRVGAIYQAEELAERLERYIPVFDAAGGGVTFSGGEPLLQAEFVSAVMMLLKGRMHVLLQTSGHAQGDVFLQTAGLADMVFFDVKLMDPARHRRFTGVDNGRILDNLRALDRSGMLYRIRLPLIPGVTDTPENYEALREFIRREVRGDTMAGLDLLPFNEAAGGKYQAVGRAFNPGFDATQPVNIQPEWFQDIVREVTVL